MVGIDIKDIDFLELENRVNGVMVVILSSYLEEKISHDEAITALEALGVHKTKAKKLLEKGLESL